MNAQNTDELITLNIDVDQWRSDIQTFVDATISELRSINDQLACGFANDRPASDNGMFATGEFPGQPEPTPVAPPTGNPFSSSDNSTPTAPTSTAATNQTEDRLASLRQKLAEKILSGPS